MNRRDYLFLLCLITAALIIYFPAFYSDYLYTDDASQLWFYSKKLNFGTSVPQGRYLTYKIFSWLFGYINTVHQVAYARSFSLLGWILCLPIWYYIIDKVVSKNNLPKTLVFLSLVYLVCMPPFSIFIGWAACMQMFIAYTAGLISGYILYAGIKYDGKTVNVSTTTMAIAAVFAVISLFTYQNGFGCFFIPFFIHFLSVKRFSKNILIGIAFSFLIYIVYYFLFKYSISSNGLGVSDRAAFTTNPVSKLAFLFARPLVAAFHFTWLFNEDSIAGYIVSAIFAAALLFAFFLAQKKINPSQNIIFLLGLLCFFILVYFPSLLVKENFSSYRTLFAFNLTVFLMVAQGLFSLLKKNRVRNIAAASLGFIFLVNAWYNYNRQFLQPLKIEHSLISGFIDQHFKPNITTINYICPKENYFEKKYNLIRSWDEFGVASTAKKWVPEPLIKQLIFEKTGNRQLAESIIVKCWTNKEVFEKSAEAVTNNSMTINFEDIMTK